MRVHTGLRERQLTLVFLALFQSSEQVCRAGRSLAQVPLSLSPRKTHPQDPKPHRKPQEMSVTHITVKPRGQPGKLRKLWVEETSWTH